jgi:branched-chain amino acid transport system ATP-binding protein
VTIALEIKGLTKRYGAMVAVNDLSFSVSTGETLGICGPNGAGKTTLFDVITGLVPASEGSIRFFGRDITGASAQELCRLGLSRTFQLNAVFDSMTVQENLLASAYFGSQRRKIPALRFDQGSKLRAAEAMEVIGLTAVARKEARTLPVFERKLLMLASAIVTHPRLLMLDEPVGGLNANEVSRCIEVVRGLRNFHGLTVVVIEHVMSFITAVAERVLIMHHGAKLYEGDVEGMAKDSTVVDVYLGASGARALGVAEVKTGDAA